MALTASAKRIKAWIYEAGMTKAGESVDFLVLPLTSGLNTINSFYRIF
jgi:hypothetical protein